MFRPPRGVLVVGGIAALLGLLSIGWTLVEEGQRPSKDLIVRPEPDEWRVEPGESAEVFLHLKSHAREPTEVSLTLAPETSGGTWLSVTPSRGSVTLQPREEVRVPFTLTASATRAPAASELGLRADWTERGVAYTSDHQIRVIIGPEPMLDPRDLAPYAAVGAGLAGLGLIVARIDWRLVGGWILAPLYSRIARSEALESERRQRIVAAIAASPWLHFAELSRRTGLPNGTLYHHLRILQQNGLVLTRKERGRRVYALSAAPLPPGEIVTDAEQRILDLLSSEGRTAAELAERLGITRQGVYYHAQKLAARGLLREESAEGSTRYYRS